MCNYFSELIGFWSLVRSYVSRFLDKLLLWCHTKVQWPLDFRGTDVLKFGVTYLGLEIQITILETL